MLLQDVVASSSLVTTFDMIGGMDDMKEEIMDIVSILACSLSVCTVVSRFLWNFRANAPQRGTEVSV